MQKQIHVWISGIVQGVGYRLWLKTEAQKFNLTGWVKNLADGRVEAVFQGDPKAIVAIINNCYEGSYSSSVEQIESQEEELENFQDFSIL